MGSSFRYDPVLRGDQFDKTIDWAKQNNRRINVDPELDLWGDRRVYRYASKAEVKTLVNNGEWWFGRPIAWKDKYEHHIAELLFDGDGPFRTIGVYAKCFTFEYMSEPMWRLNKGRIRLAFDLRDLIESLSRATDLNGDPLPKLYIGRARYMRPEAIRAAADSLCANPPGSPSRYAAPSLLMKRLGFHYENEIRICFLAGPTTPKVDEFKIKLDAPIKAMLIDPYMTDKQVAKLAAYYRRRGLSIHQSQFNLDPNEL